MHRAISNTIKLVNHAVIATGHTLRTKTQLRAPTAPHFWTLHRQPNRLLSQSKRGGRHANIKLIRSSRIAFIRINLTPGDVSHHPMPGQPIHPCEFPKNRNHGLEWVDPLTLEEVPQAGTEFVFLESQDRVERH